PRRARSTGGIRRRRRRRLGLGRLVLLLADGHEGGRRGERWRTGGGGRRRFAAQLHLVAAVLLLRQVDDLAVVGLAQHLLELGGLERLALALLQRVDSFAQLLGADRAFLPAEAAERLFDERDRAVE